MIEYPADGAGVERVVGDEGTLSIAHENKEVLTDLSPSLPREEPNFIEDGTVVPTWPHPTLLTWTRPDA